MINRRSHIALFATCLTLLVAFFSPASIQAATVVGLSWNANTEADLDGYIIRYGTSPGLHTDSVDVGNVTSHQFSGLAEGTAHYFVVLAYDEAGNEGPPSVEISAVPTLLAPVLTLSATGAPDPVAAGDIIIYTFDFMNSGNVDATGVILSDTVPARTSFASATAGGTLSGNTVTWAIGGLSAGAGGSVELQVRVDSPLPDGTTISNDVSSIESNEVPAVGGGTVSTTVTSAPLLSIVLSGAPDPVAAGGALTYTLDYGNGGNADATGVVITDTVPLDTSLVSATAGGTLSGNSVSWAIGNLAAGAAGSVQMVVQVDNPLPNGTIITNDSAGIGSNETSPITGAAVSTTVTFVPVLSLTLNGAPDPVTAGGTLTYTLDYSNSGNGTATGVVLSDEVPAATTFVSATAGGAVSGTTVSWTIGSLAAGTSGTIQLVVQVDSPLPNGSTITNDTARLDSVETVAVSGDPISTTVTSSPVLSIAKSDAPDPVAAGDPLTYTLSFTNTGNAGATGVVVTDTLPPGTSFVSATAGGTLAGGTVTWTIGDLFAGESGSALLVVQVDSPLPDGTTITDANYSIASNETPAVSGATVTTTVTSAPLLSIVLSGAPDPVAAGGTLTYTIDYANGGNADATGVVITDTVPLDTSLVSATAGGTLSGNSVSWAIGNLAAGAAGSVQMVVQVDNPLPNGTIITNDSAGIGSNETSPITGAAVSTTVTFVPVLSLTLNGAPDPVTAGGTLTYTLDYSNSGNGTATGVVLSDEVPAATTFVSATAGGAVSGTTVSWTIGSLAAGTSGTIQLVVQVDSPLPNGSTITNDTARLDSVETVAVSGDPISTTVTSSPVLSIAKSDAPDPVAAGDPLTYTLSFTNTGNAGATGVVVTDTLPPGTSFVSATAGGTLAGGTVTWTIGDLFAGESGSALLVVQVDSPLPDGTTITDANYSIASNETPAVSGATVTTTVTSAPLLSIVLSDAPDPVAAGGALTYTIDYANGGNADATGVVITDTVPANTSFVSATAGGTPGGNIVSWAIGNLASGAAGSVQIVVQVDSPLADGTIITNDISAVAANETAPMAAAGITTTVTSTPVLSITPSDSPDPVAAGATLTYTLDYANSGNTDATGVVITDAVPANTTFVSATSGGAINGGTVSWTIGDLPAGSTGAVQMVVRVDTPLADGTIIANDTAAIGANGTAVVNGAGLTTTVTSSPVLSIALTDSPDPAVAGGLLTYTLDYGNSGNADATAVVISDAVPARTTFVSATAGGTLSGTTVTWAPGILAAGGTGSVEMVVRVDSPLPHNSIITNGSYSITSTETGPVNGSAITTSVNSAPGLQISKTHAPDPVPMGGTLTYTIDYSNTGNADATGVVVTDVLPQQTLFVSATAGGGNSAGTVTWSIGSLPAGTAGSVQVVVRVTSPLPEGTVITSDAYSINSNEIGPVSGPSDVAAVITAAPPTVTAALDIISESIYVVPGGTHTLRVEGSGFQSGAALNLSPDITVGSTTLLDPTVLEVTINIDPSAALGTRTLTVTNPDLGAGSLSNALVVVNPPDINANCLVDGSDLNGIARAWNSMRDETWFIPAADLDGDDFVGPNDLAIFVVYFGKPPATCPWNPLLASAESSTRLANARPRP